MNLFIKDIFDKKTIYRSIFVSVFLYLITKLCFSNNAVPMKTFSEKTCLYIMFGLCVSVFFFVRTYIKNDRVLLYYALPLSKVSINEHLVLSILLDTVIRKMSLVLAVMLGMNATADSYLTLVFSLPGIVILGCITSVIDIGTCKKISTSFISLSYCCFVVTVCKYTSLVFATGLCIFACFLYYICIRNFFLKRACFRLKLMRNLSAFSLSNYFLKFFLAENVYIINTVFITVMVVFISLFMPKELRLCLACAVGAINTPLLTVFSTEKELTDMNNMLPSTYKNLRRDYIFILAIYFALIQFIIMLLNIGGMSIKMIIGLILITIIEVCGSYYLEQNYRITNCKTVTEVWRNPRKYILSVIVFFITFTLQAI